MQSTWPVIDTIEILENAGARNRHPPCLLCCYPLAAAGPASHEAHVTLTPDAPCFTRPPQYELTGACSPACGTALGSLDRRSLHRRSLYHRLLHCNTFHWRSRLEVPPLVLPPLVLPPLVLLQPALLQHTLLQHALPSLALYRRFMALSSIIARSIIVRSRVVGPADSSLATARARSLQHCRSRALPLAPPLDVSVAARSSA